MPRMGITTPLRKALALGPPTLTAAIGLVMVSCASPGAKVGELDGTGSSGLGQLFLRKSDPATTRDALQQIADSPAAQLPAIYRAEPVELSPEDEESGWESDGLHPHEVHPGDIFVERDGARLRKLFSVCDGLDEDSRRSELSRYASTAVERMPVTLSRAELLELEKSKPGDQTFPTRSVALDVRSSTHTLDPGRFQELLAEIEKSRKGDARQQRLRAQLREVKSRLARGEELQIVTAVTESAEVLASYPGAPVGKRDADPVRNAILAAFPHLGNPLAEKVEDKIRVSGQPRLVWEFDSEAFTIERDRLVLAAAE